KESRARERLEIGALQNLEACRRTAGTAHSRACPRARQLGSRLARAIPDRKDHRYTYHPDGVQWTRGQNRHADRDLRRTVTCPLFPKLLDGRHCAANNLQAADKPVFPSAETAGHVF